MKRGEFGSKGSRRQDWLYDKILGFVQQNRPEHLDKVIAGTARNHRQEAVFHHWAKFDKAPFIRSDLNYRGYLRSQLVPVALRVRLVPTAPLVTCAFTWYTAFFTTFFPAGRCDRSLSASNAARYLPFDATYPCNSTRSSSIIGATDRFSTLHSYQSEFVLHP